MEHDMRVARTKGSLREALLRIMKDKPITDIRVSEVAKQAGVSRKVFYDHYADIYDLVFDCYETYCVSIGADVRFSEFEDKRDGLARLIETTIRQLEFCRDNPRFSLAVCENALGSPYLSKLSNEGIEVSRRILDEEYTPDTTVETLLPKDIVAGCMVMGTHYIIHDWMDHGMREPIDLVARHIVYMGFYTGRCLHACSDDDEAYLRAVLAYQAQGEGPPRA